MLIKRNVYFSAVDEETGEERLFSVNEVMTEEEYLERMYSEEQREFGMVKQANKALKKALELKTGKEAFMKHAEKYRWDQQGIAEGLKNQRDLINRGRRSLREVVKKKKGNIKDNYKTLDINDKINLRDSLVNSKGTKLRIQHSGAEKIHPNRPTVEFKELGNSRKTIKNSGLDKREKEELLRSYDHGKVDSRGRLESGRDMGYGNYEHNVFRAGSGHGYRKTW